MFQTQRFTVAAECAELRPFEADFAAQIATAVWLRRLTDDAAREALWSYAIARHPNSHDVATAFGAALLAEYRHRRERLDLVS